MRKWLSFTSLSVLALVLLPSLAIGKTQSQYLLPPGMDLFGTSYDRWMGLYWQWAWPDFYGDPDAPPDSMGKVSFLRVPIPEGEISTTVKKGQFIVLPMVVLSGESYDKVPADDPDDFGPEQYLQFRLEIDGETVIDSLTDNDDLTPFLFQAYYLDPPFLYPEPELRFREKKLGNVSATGVVWSEGTGCILKPLPVGEHMIRSISYFPLFDVYLGGTIHLTVTE